MVFAVPPGGAVGDAAVALRNALLAAGVPRAAARRAAVAAYEVESNLLVHEGAGELRARVGDGFVEVVARGRRTRADAGPGAGQGLALLRRGVGLLCLRTGDDGRGSVVGYVVRW